MSGRTTTEKTGSETTNTTNNNNNGQDGENNEPNEHNNSNNTVTMADILNQQLELEHEATYELQENWGDEEKCTFNSGYITQPVYACDTCSKASGNNLFGFCFGCSMNCHLDHEVYELFKKRNFRCDCGTPKSNCKCELHDNVHSRDQDNLRNAYNHNFLGKYCWCDNPYDHDGDVSMIQCVVCEDWFHSECIANEIEKCRNVNTTNEFVPVCLPEEADAKYSLVCGDCVKKLPFLAKYPQLTEFHTYPSLPTTTTPSKENPENHNESTTNDGNNTNLKVSETNEVNSANSTENQNCKIEGASVPPSISSLFFSPGWRTKLCTCSNCSNMYRLLDVYYLLEETDEVENEEEEEEININSENNNNNNNNTLHPPISLYHSAEQAFLGVPTQKKRQLSNQQVPERISTGMVNTTLPSGGGLIESVPKKLEMAMAFSEMSNELREYLRKFADEGKVVTENDILQFFETLKGSKKRRKE